MVFDPPARSRRKWLGRLIWPALIVIAAVVAVVVTAAGAQTRSELEYLDEIRSQATALSRSGASIADIMARLREVDRAEFTTVFDAASTDLDVALEFVSEEPPTETLIPVWALYRQAVESWSEGVDRLSRSVLQAADNPGETIIVNDVGDALAELRGGDALFLDLKAEFERDEIPEPVSPPVDVTMSPSEGGMFGLATSYVAAAQSSTNGLGLRPGLRVSQVLTDPQWSINVEGQPVVPSTDAVTFSVVVTNSGNVESTPESISIELVGGAEPVLAQAEVPALRPNGQTTITFDPIPVEPDVVYEISVELIVSGLDADLDDNIRVVQFVVNPA